MNEEIEKSDQTSSIIKALLKQARERQKSNDNKATELKKICQTYIDQPQKFKPGDLVIWKDRLKNKKRPDLNTPVVVVEHLDNPVYDEEINAGSAYFREPLDLKVGFMDDDGDFMIFHYDSNRFKLYLED